MFAHAFQDNQKNLLAYSKNGKPYEILAAVLAARQFNTSIVETDLRQDLGKKRALKVNYYPPVCTDTGDCTVTLCDNGTKIEPKQAFFEISQCTSSEQYSLEKNDIRLVDGNWTFSDHAKMQINSVLPTVRRKLAIAVTALLWSNKGILIDGNASQLLPYMDKSTGQVNPMGLWEIERQYRDAGMSEPFIVGGTDVFYWRKAVEIGGLNQLGQNVAQMGRTNVYYDTLVNEAAADDTYEHILAFNPQLIKFVSFNRNAGIFATTLDNIDAIDAVYQKGGTDYIEGVMADPLTGLLWDLNVNYDKCTHTWDFHWKLEWDIFFMPQQVCNIDGVNGIMWFRTCAPVQATCPEGTPISPLSSRPYSASTAGITFPYYVHEMTVAGQTTQPNASVADATELAAMLTEEIQGYAFSAVGATIQYTGYSAISGVLNPGDATTETLTWS